MHIAQNQMLNSDMALRRLKSFFENNISVGFGSDSMASNNTCDILEEARFATLLARTREDKNNFLDAKKMIETATLGGAKRSDWKKRSAQ